MPTKFSGETLDRLRIWQNPATAKRLSWYLAVADNRKPAKFRIARTVAVDPALRDVPEDTLWTALDAATPVFLRRWRDIWEGRDSLGPPASPNLLELCDELCRRMLTHCNFCRWDCGVDRANATKYGTCKLGGETRVSSYFHHRGEELVYRGLHGSGTIFFTSCNMRCTFCQNGDISTDKDNGMEVDAKTLAAMAWLLRLEGCHNINWVGGDPIIHLHTIVAAIALLGHDFATPDETTLREALRVKADHTFFHHDRDPEWVTYESAFNAPMLWNSNFFASPEAMKILRILIDVCLPDFKFGPGRCAIKLARTPRYWETVTKNLKAIEDWGENVTIRHLVMPNHV